MYGPRMKLAFTLAICLFGIVSNAMATCSPTTQNAVSPADVISITGPSVPADQQALGVTSYTYLWTIKQDNANGAAVTTGFTNNIKDLTWTVPPTGYSSNYYVDLLVTAPQSTTSCVNEVCFLFPVTAATTCSLTAVNNAPDLTCITDNTDRSYTITNPGSQFVVRWWLFPPGVTVPTQVGYTDYTGASGMANYKLSDSATSSGNIKWSDKATAGSGVYTIYVGIYAKSTKAWQSSCTKQVTIIAQPSVLVSVQ